MVKVDLTGAAGFFTAAGPDYELAALAHKTLADKSGLGNDFTGWVELPRRIKETELERIVAAAEKIRSRSKALVVIGIGGSYLGARGAIDLLKPMPGKDDPKVFFMGNTLSTDTICDTIAALGDMDFDVNVISKSGTTLEPAVSFRIFREILAKKYGDKADEHIFATTDEHKGVLHGLAEQHGWESFSTARATASSCWPATSRASASWRNGGSSSTARARARTARAYSPPPSSLTPTCTPWGSSYRMARAR